MDSTSVDPLFGLSVYLEEASCGETEGNQTMVWGSADTSFLLQRRFTIDNDGFSTAELLNIFGCVFVKYIKSVCAS